MSLPPDPHDDDLAEPSPGVSSEPPPSPAYAEPPPIAGRPAPASPPEGTAPAPVDLDGPPPKSRLGVMLAGVVAVIAIAGGIVVATGGDEDEASGGADQAASGEPPAGAPATAALSPVEVAEDFFAAIDARDCEGMVGRMTPESYAIDGQTVTQAVAECESDRSGTAAAAAAEFDDIALVSERGDTATVSVTVTLEGVSRARELPLRRVDGEWLMHLDASLAEPVT